MGEGLKIVIGAVVFGGLFLYGLLYFMKSNSGEKEAVEDPSIIRTELPVGNRGVWTVEHDGCEYIYVRRLGEIEFLHKENCKYCELSKK